MSNTIKGPFIVTGASGQLGSQVIEALLEEGAEPLVAVTRSPEKLEALRARGVEIRAGDFNDPATLGPAFAGGGRLLIISTDDLAPGKRFAAHRNAISAAKEAGVSHIVYTSLTNPDEGNPIGFARDHRETEASIKDTGISHTILRNCLLHMMLPVEAVPQIVDLGWAEPHPMAAAGMIPSTAVMVYGPRNEVEIETVLELLRLSYDFACGKLGRVDSVVL